MTLPLTPVEEMTGDGAEDLALLRQMAHTARNYISSFSWCPPIESVYVGFGIGGVVAVFLVEFQSVIAETDKRLWVIVGDVPSAYIVVEHQDSPREAIERYCELMDDWIVSVLSFGDASDVFPVEAPRTSENAEMLRSRLDFIRSEIIPHIPANLF